MKEKTIMQISARIKQQQSTDIPKFIHYKFSFNWNHHSKLLFLRQSENFRLPEVLSDDSPVVPLSHVDVEEGWNFALWLSKLSFGAQNMSHFEGTFGFLIVLVTCHVNVFLYWSRSKKQLSQLFVIESSLSLSLTVAENLNLLSFNFLLHNFLHIYI